MGDWWWLICIVPLSLAFILAFSEAAKDMNKSKIRRLKRKLRKYEQGESDMSKIISELVGKKCRLEIYGEITVLDADEEWLKYEYTDKKGNKCVKIQRIDELSEIDLLD